MGNLNIRNLFYSRRVLLKRKIESTDRDKEMEKLMENKALAESHFLFMDSVSWQGTYLGSITEKREAGTITMHALQ